MAERQVRQIVLSNRGPGSIHPLHTEVFGFLLKFPRWDRNAALGGDPITIALATSLDHPAPGQVVFGEVRRGRRCGADGAHGGGIARAAYDDAHQRQAVA